MALAKPTIVITQSRDDLPFDIHDIQTIEYDRVRLGSTLGGPLCRSIVDTLRMPLAERGSPKGEAPSAEAFASLLAELGTVKDMMRETMRALKLPESADADPSLAALVGAWINSESGSHCYPKLVKGQLIAPYCYRGDESLTGVYFGWRRIGQYWFARYQWIDSHPAGFTFLRPEGSQVLQGAWWSSEEVGASADEPPSSAGVPATWVRQPLSKFPDWADEFLAKVEDEGIEKVLDAARRRKSRRY